MIKVPDEIQDYRTRLTSLPILKIEWGCLKRQPLIF